MKLKIKLLLAAVAVCLLTVLIYTSSKTEKVKLATVLSTEPIKANRLVEYENCTVTGMIGNFSQAYLSRFHPAQNECKMVFMLEALQGKSFPDFQERANQTCVTSTKKEAVVVGYDVVYRIDKTIGKVRTSFEPGLFIPLNEDGRLDLSQSTNPFCATMRSDVKELLPFYCLKQTELPMSNNASAVLRLDPGKNTYGFYE